MPVMKFIVQELPIIKFIRSFRTVIRIIGETLVAYCTGKVEQLYRLLSDVTGRRQTALQNLSIVVIDEERMHPLILSTSTNLERGTSDNQVYAVMLIIAF